MIRKKFVGIILCRAVLASALLMCGVTYGHHSNAMFDEGKTVVLRGKVKEFQWTNPHCWIELAVTEPVAGQDWSVQMGPPVNLYRDGWRPGVLHPGDELLVTVHPMRDGSRGGIWVSGTHLDGSPIGHAAK